MKHCPITYQIINEKDSYSEAGLKRISPRLAHLQPLEWSAAEQREEAIARAGKMSIQGVQTKLSARLNIKENRFDLVDQQGQFILKPQSQHYAELPENEALTMSLAAMIDIEVPLHGLLYSKDGSMTYFIKRFDRMGRHDKLSVEDFAQLTQAVRDTKYNSSMEKIANVITEFCSFPKIENVKLFKLMLFNFLTGNEDMHLKNFSLITRDNKITLSPAYDLLNTTIAQKNTREEIALPLHGKKKNLQRKDFLEYFAVEKLGLNQVTIDQVIQQIEQSIPDWKILIEKSFLSPLMQTKYLELLTERWKKIL